MWEDVVLKLKNIPYSYSLIVSVVRGNYADLDIEKIKHFNKNTQFLILENKGLDILPFLKALKVVLPSTRFILKIHTKKSTHAQPHVGKAWFDGLMNRVLPDRLIVDKILHNLEYSDIGMVGGSDQGGYGGVLDSDDSVEPHIELIYNFFKTKHTNYKWIAGTIFWSRFDILQPLLNEDFLKYVERLQPPGYVENSTIVHGLERYFGKLVYDAGKIIASEPCLRYSKQYISLLPGIFDPASGKKEICVFIHVCCVNNYREITKEIFEEIISSGLYEKSKNIFISLLGSPDKIFMKWLQSFSKCIFIYENSNIDEVEYPTLGFLQEFCRKNDTYVAYFHTKGVLSSDPVVASIWRKRMIEKTITEYESCLAFLQKGFDVSGCGWKEFPHHGVELKYDIWSHPHFSGNYWWATSDYIKSLPDIRREGLQFKKRNDIQTERGFFDYRILCEMWIGMNPIAKVGVNGDLNISYTGDKYPRIKLLFVSHENSMTGASKILFEIAETFHNNVFFEVLIVSRDVRSEAEYVQKGEYKTIDSIYDIPIVYSNIFDTDSIENLCVQYNPDLIYINTIVPYPWVKYAIDHDVPYILHVHENGQTLKNFEPYFEYFIDKVDGTRVIAVSSNARKDLNSFGVPNSLLIHEFVNTDKIDTLVLSDDLEVFPKEINKDKPIILAVGSLAHRKGADIFIETARQLPSLQFIWLGFAFDKDILRNTPENFWHISEKENPYQLMNQASLVVLPSREDPFPLIILEALYLNIPVVCFKNGVGSSEILSGAGYVLDGGANVDVLVGFLKNFNFSIQKKDTANLIKKYFSNHSQIPKIQALVDRVLSRAGIHQEDYFLNKIGLEVGGPSEIFSSMIPAYQDAKKIDGINFSEHTLWDSRESGAKKYKYFSDKNGDQYTSEATNLSFIEDNVYDFLLASHVLEHIANPMKALVEWVRVVKAGGRLVIVVPNKNECFDHNRSYTSFTHVMNDFLTDVGENDLTHLNEILENHDLTMDPPAGNFDQFKDRSLNNLYNRALHHHVFSLELLQELCNFLGLYIERSYVEGIHIVCIVRTPKDVYFLGTPAKNYLNFKNETPVKENSNDVFNKICTELISQIPNRFPVIKKNTIYKSLLIETRILPHLEFLIKNTIQKLGTGWGHIIFCSKENYAHIKNICDQISPNIELYILKKVILTRNDYNNLLLDPEFWDNIHCEKVLVYQSDTFLFKILDSKFLDWDYVGSSWAYRDKFAEMQSIQNVHDLFDLEGHLYVGNGGLSLRSIDMMKFITEQYSQNSNYSVGIVSDLDHPPEDVVVSALALKSKLYKIAPIEICNEFSFESVYQKDTFGCHQPFSYMPIEHLPLKSKYMKSIGKTTPQGPLVSIVTVVYNIISNGREKYFRQCIESVRSQIYDNVEHVIIDGGSTDGTVNLIEEYSEKGWVSFISEPDSGIYDAMNKGAHISKGVYISFLNSDDYYQNSSTISLSVKELEKKLVDFAYGKAIYLYEDGTICDDHPHTNPNIKEVFSHMPFCHQTMFVRKDVFNKSGFFDTKYKIAGDYDFTLRICLANHTSVFIPHELVTFRYGGFSTQKDLLEKIASEIAMCHYCNYSKVAPVTLEDCGKIWGADINQVPKIVIDKIKKENNYLRD